MNILHKIVATKKEEVAAAKKQVAVSELERTAFFKAPPLVFKDYLLAPERSGIIAEFKKQSPSKGIINASASIIQTTKAYAQAGASAISVLTDTVYFGGNSQDLITARHVNNIPILRKDFIIDEYQILEAKAWGADIILLIAAILNPQQIKQLSATAQNLGLNVLLEVHSLQELEQSLCYTLNAVGVNNRNLDTFNVDLQTSFQLAPHIPAEFLKIAESAITTPKDVLALREAGFQGFLIGENFMKHNNPGEAMQEFVKNL